MDLSQLQLTLQNNEFFFSNCKFIFEFLAKSRKTFGKTVKVQFSSMAKIAYDSYY